MKKLIVIALCSISSISIGTTLAKPNSSAQVSAAKSQANLNVVWNSLRPIIVASRKPVVLYFQANCRKLENNATEDPVLFPPVKVRSASKSKKGVDAIREVFENDRNVSVIEDATGVLRILIGQPSRSVLQTMLPRVTFDPLAQYNPSVAFGTILETQEMQKAMSSLNVGTVPSFGGTVAEPSDGLPHLEGSMTDVTLENALDSIARIWAGEGIVIYGACSESTGRNGKTLFWLDYLGDLLPR